MSISDHSICIAQTKTERRAIYEFRYQVYIEEMGKPYSQADHEQRIFNDPLDERATLLYSTREGEIVGTVRINWGDDTQAIAAFAGPFDLHKFQSFPTASLSFSSRLMVHRDYRHSALAAALSTAAYQKGRQRDVQFNFVHCNPRLVRLFERMGFRRYKQSFHDSEIGEQVPLVLVLEDIGYLIASRSPFLNSALERPNNSHAGLWFANRFSTTQDIKSEVKETINNSGFDKSPITTATTQGDRRSSNRRISTK